MAEMMDFDEESRKQLDRWVEAKRGETAAADRIRGLLEAKGIGPIRRGRTGAAGFA